MVHLDFIFQCFVHYNCVFYVQKCLLHAIWQISQLTFQKNEKMTFKVGDKLNIIGFQNKYQYKNLRMVYFYLSI